MNYIRRKGLSILTIAIVILIVLVVGGGVTALTVSTVSAHQQTRTFEDELDETREQIKTLIDTYTRLYQDCEDAAGCDSTAPAPEVIEEVLPVIGPQGDPGRAPTEAEISNAVAAYCIQNDQCRGAVGAAGQDGGQGQTGAAGTPGQDGQDGADGAPGTPGTNGQPPTGWTYQDAFGVTHTCTRTTPFDTENPTYTCD